MAVQRVTNEGRLRGGDSLGQVIRVTRQSGNHMQIDFINKFRWIMSKWARGGEGCVGGGEQGWVAGDGMGQGREGGQSLAQMSLKRKRKCHSNNGDL